MDIVIKCTCPGGVWAPCSPVGSGSTINVWRRPGVLFLLHVPIIVSLYFKKGPEKSQKCIPECLQEHSHPSHSHLIVCSRPPRSWLKRFKWTCFHGPGHYLPIAFYVKYKDAMRVTCYVPCTDFFRLREDRGKISKWQRLVPSINHAQLYYSLFILEA